ncbi:hypothetical protein SeseC_00334 [Streptococcus equi subsp. zooepidemicus ATCC 35246]|nr:hypothetical protein SeseC_00334 [Streptococcus equi subsp. zooepidemicus ATCC 35246]
MFKRSLGLARSVYPISLGKHIARIGLNQFLLLVRGKI